MSNNDITNLYGIRVLDQNNNLLNLQPKADLIYTTGDKLHGHLITDIRFEIDSVSVDVYVTVYVYVDETIKS